MLPTIAVKLTACPKLEGLSDEVSDVLVAAGLITKVPVVLP